MLTKGLMMPILLTLLSLLLYALAFPPFSVSLIAWVALAPFFIAISQVRPARATLCGLLWGVGAAYGVGWWFPAMVANYLQVPLWVGWIAFFAVSSGLAGVYYGAFAAWLSWILRRQRSSVLLFAAGWGVCEFARARLLLGNPWALSCYSQVGLPSLMQTADVAGPYGVSMCLAAVNACVAGIAFPLLRSKRPFLSYLGTGAVLSLAYIYGQSRLSQSFIEGAPVSIGVIQGAVEQQFRGKAAYVAENLQRYIALSQKTAPTQPVILFWPEYAVDFFLQQDIPFRETVLHLSRTLNVDLILGGQYYEYGEKDIVPRNSIFLVRRGQLADRYDKVHLLPFAEHNPLPQLFPQIHNHYQAGEQIRLLRTTAAQVGAFLCFESMYPEFVRMFARKGAEILVNLSNDNWFGDGIPAQHQLEIASLRAIENRRYLVRSTATGVSAVVDPYGRIMTASTFGVPAVLTASVYRSHATTFYQRYGDLVAWTAVFFVTGVSLYHLVWRSNPRKIPLLHEATSL